MNDIVYFLSAYLLEKSLVSELCSRCVSVFYLITFDRHLCFFHVSAKMKKDEMSTNYKSLCGHMFSFLLARDLWQAYIQFFEKLPIFFFQHDYTISHTLSALNICDGSPSATLGTSSLFHLSHLQVQYHFQVGFVLVLEIWSHAAQTSPKPLSSSHLYRQLQSNFNLQSSDRYCVFEYYSSTETVWHLWRSRCLPI